MCQLQKCALQNKCQQKEVGHLQNCIKFILKSIDYGIQMQKVKTAKYTNQQIQVQILFTITMEPDEQIIRIGNYTSKFRGQDLLATGYYGSVYVGHQINHINNKVAIKVISIQKSSLAQVLNEVACMLNLRSQGTLEILATQKIRFGVNEQQHYAIVTEKMDGSLLKLLKQKGKLTEAQAIEWGRKIIECYKYLYKAKVIHRDLKPDNVLYKKFGDQIIFKIGDFGLSRSSNTSNLTNTGTPFYVSPQQEKQANYTDKTDVYAFGCMLFEFLVGPQKLFSEVIKVIGTSNGSVNKRETVKVAIKVISDIGVSELMIQLVEGCLAYEESDRLAWKDVFQHKIFQQTIEIKANTINELINEREIIPENKKLDLKDIKKVESKINKLKIIPDTTTFAWKQRLYRQDNTNKKICISQGHDSSEWLCSSDLSFNGECLFTIKAVKIFKYSLPREIKGSAIWIGVMESKVKREKERNTLIHCVYLQIPGQNIVRPNEEQTDREWIKCSCQPFLTSLPCLIECHLSRNQNTITWHYNGKDQAKSSMPNSWKDGRKLCAVVIFWKLGDCVEFMR